METHRHLELMKPSVFMQEIINLVGDYGIISTFKSLTSHQENKKKMLEQVIKYYMRMKDVYSCRWEDSDEDISDIDEGKERTENLVDKIYYHDRYPTITYNASDRSDCDSDEEIAGVKIKQKLTDCTDSDGEIPVEKSRKLSDCNDSDEESPSSPFEKSKTYISGRKPVINDNFTPSKKNNTINPNELSISSDDISSDDEDILNTDEKTESLTENEIVESTEKDNTNQIKHQIYKLKMDVITNMDILSREIDKQNRILKTARNGINNYHNSLSEKQTELEKERMELEKERIEFNKTKKEFFDNFGEHIDIYKEKSELNITKELLQMATKKLKLEREKFEFEKEIFNKKKVLAKPNDIDDLLN